MAGNPLINNIAKNQGDPRFGQFGAGGTATAQNPYGQQGYGQAPYGQQQANPYGYQQGNQYGRHRMVSSPMGFPRIRFLLIS